jgi:hypothetical protein
MKSPWVKRLVIGFGALFALLILLIIILPLVIDVDKYRPQITQVANEHINGKLSLGKLQLSLWGQIKIQVDGIELTDASSRKILTVKDVYFHVPFSSVLSGSPAFELRMTKPDLVVVKDKKGKLNALTLVKEQPQAKGQEASSPATKPGDQKPDEPTQSKSVPGVVARARIGLQMKEAHFLYRDELTGLTSEVKDLNVFVKNLSLTRPTEAEIGANLDTQMGKTLSVQGPARITAKIEPNFQGTQFQSAKVTARMDMDKVAITLPNVFEKKAGLETNAGIIFVATPTSVKVDELFAKFFNVHLTGNGSVNNFENPEILFSLKSNDVDLKPWSELLVALRGYDLSGTASFDANVKGRSPAPQYAANLLFKEISAKAPNLKAQPKLEGHVKVVTDQVESLGLTLKAPGNDLRIVGKVVSFTKPRIDATISSNGMDLDQLINFPPPGAKAADPASAAPAPAANEKAKAGGGKAGSSTAAGAEDYDALLDPLRKNPVAANTTANIRFNLASVKAKNVKISDLGGVLLMKNLVLQLENFRMGLFSGKIGGGFALQVMPKTPTYRFNGDVAGLNLQEAVASQFEMFKNTLVGKASFKIDGTGASLNPDPMMRNLSARGNMKVENAQFASIDIGKVVSEAINKSVAQIGEKVPALKGKSLGAPGNIESKYSVVTSDFTIAGGRFSAPNFFAKAEPNKGIDLKGDTNVGLLDKGLKAKWEVIDTYNLTKARDLSVEQQGVKVDHILADGNDPVKFPVEVSGTIAAPVFSYGAVPEALGKVALSNVGKAVAGKAKAEVQKRAKEQVEQLSKQAPAPVQDAIKKFGGGLFGK